jgi:hypothetical protein
MGVAFWSLAIYACVFIIGYFAWALYKNSKEE